ncbi:MAG: MBL fold metallo-hydrolase, partial [Deferrisomatales bacterium]
LYEARSRAVIGALRAAGLTKLIGTVVVTHFHFDHGGGVRAYAAEGAEVVVGAASRGHFEAVLAAPHTLVPDALAHTPQPTLVTAVPPDGLALADGAVVVYPVSSPDQTHAADLVIAHVPAEGLIFVSDLLSPQAPVAAAALPAPLRGAITRFGLTVRAIAGGHGALVPVL